MSQYSASSVGESCRRPQSRSRITLFFFAFTAAIAFVLVNIVDPYSGATASPYFQTGERYNGIPTQRHIITTVIDESATRDGYTVTEKAPEVASTPQSTSNKSNNTIDNDWVAPKMAIPNPGSAQAIAYEKIMARGWGEAEYSCLVSLWSRESGWRVNALNSSSGAYGIPQSLPGNKMASAGSDWETNPATQIEWGLGYIAGRYSTPCGAWEKSESSGWY
jgi:hypothetical protein